MSAATGVRQIDRPVLLGVIAFAMTTVLILASGLPGHPIG